MKTTLIGNTPLVNIKVRYNGKINNIFAKLEYYNYSGSIKDRVAEYVILKSKALGLLKDGMPIIEATSGNTGISFASLGARYGHPVHIFMPDWVSQERVKILKNYGAKVYLVSKEDGGFKEAISRADSFANKIGGFRPNQFKNELNTLAHYNFTGQEIVDKICNISAFISGFGTGGTLMGVGQKIKENNPNAILVAVEPKNMTLLSKIKVVGSHKIEGIGDDFLPDLVDTNLIDKVVTISDTDAIMMARKLAQKLGLGVGISSGANFLASVLLGMDRVVTIFADDFKKYLSTDLFDENLTKSNLIDSIELVSIEVIN